MSDKSGISPQVLALPSGGGAIQGIGETFAPDPSTGTGQLSIPIAIPPGRNGLQPALTLAYSSGSGNGPFGLGWSVHVPGITRKTSTGVPRYLDDHETTEPDTFILSGLDDLVDIGPAAPGITYRPRTEGAFARVQRLRGSDSDIWQVQGKDGITSEYGGSNGAEVATLADPAHPNHVFDWRLSETLDPFGNRVEYRYLHDRNTIGLRAWDQLYLHQVRYVDLIRDGQPGFLVNVTFVYADRPDPFSDHRAGFEVRTRLRCQRIEVHVQTDADRLVRSYELNYVDDRIRLGELPGTAAPANGLSLLSSVTSVGHDEDRTQRLPPLTFDYTAPRGGNTAAFPLRSPNGALPIRSLADNEFELVSLFANGLPDVVQLGAGSSQFWRNRGNGILDGPHPLTEIPVNVSLAEAGVQLADLNGDGRADLLVLGRGGYFPQGFGGRWERFVEYPQAPSIAFDDTELRLVDLDGDGVVDALRTGQDFELFLNDPHTGWQRPQLRSRGPAEEFPNVRFSDPRVKLADLSGDGLQDIVLLQQGRIDYWPYLGHGRWAPRITMEDPPVFPSDVPGADFDPRRVLLGDLDGDGLDDVVYVGPRQVTFWINRGGNGWGPPTTIGGIPRLKDPDAVRLLDMLGTGTHGILWSDDTGDVDADTNDGYQFLDVIGPKPYLLAGIDNHIGATTQITYATSTTAYQRDEDDASTRWDTPLPFPVHVVETVAVADRVSGGTLSSRFRYSQGYWDGAEREFRGFGVVDRLDMEAFEDATTGPSPATLLRTWFHLGPVGEESEERREADILSRAWTGDPPLFSRSQQLSALLDRLPPTARGDAFRALRGSILRTELYALDGAGRSDRPYTVTETSYSVREESHPPDGTDRVRVFFPHPVAQRTTQWERGNDPLTVITVADDYDPFGQARVRTTVACPQGWHRLSDQPEQGYLAARERIVFASPTDDALHLRDRIATTTSWDIRDSGGMQALDVATAPDGVLKLEPTGHTVNFFDGPAFTGLPAGQVGPFGALTRRQVLVATEELFRLAYAGPEGHDEPGLPPYLQAGRSTPWTPEYPPEFRSQMPPLAGYVLEEGDPAHLPGYYVNAERIRYDVQDDFGGHDAPRRGRGLPIVTRDPLGTAAGKRDTTVDYDEFDLLPASVHNPVGLVTRAQNDYRVFKPATLTDVNGNQSTVSYSPLGFLECIVQRGDPDAGPGDTLEEPSVRFTYDLNGTGSTLGDSPHPISVRTERRLHHAESLDVPDADRNRMVTSVTYSDGFGRIVQTRASAESVVFGDPVLGGGLLPVQGDPDPGRAVTGQLTNEGTPRVVVSGARTYDAKGRVVEVFEPCFDTGWEYVPRAGQPPGHTTKTQYDPLGRVIRTILPDGSENRLVPGVPVQLNNPVAFLPTPWEASFYDSNDNAGRTHPEQARGWSHVWNTPTSTVVDALGREVTRVQRHRAPARSNGGTDAVAPPRDVTTGFAYDVAGNLLSVTDALGRQAYRYVYDLTGHPLRSDSLDAGVHRSVPDALGNEVEHRDSRGALALTAQDVIGRPARRWARDTREETVTLRERLEYGDGGTPAQPSEQRAASKAANRLLALYQHHDEAGLRRCLAYDFQGNVLEEERQVFNQGVLLAGFDRPVGADDSTRPAALRVDWEPPANTSLDEHAGALLDPSAYLLSWMYDALDQPRSLKCPGRAGMSRRELQLSYDNAGALRQVRVDGTPVVEDIAYDASGRHTMTVFGNGVLTRYCYDTTNGRPLRLRSEPYTTPPPSGPGAPTYKVNGAPLQDLQYSYDLLGNMLEITERTPGCGIRGAPGAGRIADPQLRALAVAGDALVRRYSYDSLDRLVLAEGRECAQSASAEPWADVRRCGAGAPAIPGADGSSLTAAYTESYTYDDVGALQQLRHAGGRTVFKRKFNIVPETNRLAVLDVGSATLSYQYDESGNLVAETTSRHFSWDHANRLIAFAEGSGTAGPSVQTQYRYDGAGQRVTKIVRTQDGAVEITTYIGGVFEHHRWQHGPLTGENDLLHVSDGVRRVASLRSGSAHPEDPGPPVRYDLADHLASVSVTVDGTGAFLNREEYTPYGETSFGGYARKRYRFCGQERDEHTGLYHMGARYYAPGLAQWTSADPSGLSGGVNAYAYCGGNPVSAIDPTGLAPQDATGQIVMDAEGNPWAQVASTGFERVDHAAVLVGTESAWTAGTIDEQILLQGSGEIIHVQGRPVEEINGNIFSALDNEYWMLLAHETSPRQVSKSAFDNARFWSTEIAGMSDEQLGQAFGATEALERGMEVATLIGLHLTPIGRGTLFVMDAIDTQIAVSRAKSLPEAMAAMANMIDPGLLGPGRLRQGRAARQTVDTRTGHEVGRFIVDPHGNTLIEPKGGSTPPLKGPDTHTLYPNGSNYHRHNPAGHGKGSVGHAHGHLEGTGPNTKGQGQSLSPSPTPTVVPRNSRDAHWPIK
ncbi:hypothetical protein GCM10009712_33780 [Pseudarthrobacter sulfonivorans]|uniref:SpvB/TcaC N-terminal domain-containing protein n=1 Tax=Pseudarthrobacter sulfonivorans TaxID=121292 RepID=UPI00168B36CF|nr:SpvB/TcaC N-terminal domain-containing protein [Pseudarthrobacter sulfonivorans]